MAVRFMKEFVNVAHPAGEWRNRLPDLLRSWFGPAVGRRGTAFQVRFVPAPDGWWIEPAGERVPAPVRGAIRAFPTLEAAAGAAAGTAVREAEADATPDADEVRLPVSRHGEDVFAVRASGDSMDGGPRPIRDGDWLVLRYDRGAGIGSIVGRVALLQAEDETGAIGYQLKRIVQERSGWVLRSDNPNRPSFPASERTVPIAILIESIPPEDLAPSVGARLADSELAGKFGLSAPPKTGRVDGHLFICVEEHGTFVEPDRIALPVPDRRPGETAFVIARPRGKTQWGYVGVARWSASERLWASPPLDYATWKALGGGRHCSRTLPTAAEKHASELVERVLAKVGAGAWVEHGGKRCRIVAKASKGGLRVDGGPGGFAERTVSLPDLAWALVALEDVRRTVGVLDEARVNRLRYLEGTPKASTRWIDTGWAIAIALAVAS